jgi:alkyl hydroperoxide reductase subunit AhpF
MAAMLDDNIKGQVREMFTSLSNPVAILFFGSSQPDRCQYCSETAQLLSEVSELSDQLSFEKYDIDTDAELAQQYKVDGVPGYVLLGREGEKYIDYGIRAKGIPAGHEFSSLVNSLVLVSKRDSNLNVETREFLQGLTSPVHLQVFVTPT